MDSDQHCILHAKYILCSGAKRAYPAPAHSPITLPTICSKPYIFAVRQSTTRQIKSYIHPSPSASSAPDPNQSTSALPNPSHVSTQWQSTASLESRAENYITIHILAASLRQSSNMIAANPKTILPIYTIQIAHIHRHRHTSFCLVLPYVVLHA